MHFKTSLFKYTLFLTVIAMLISILPSQIATAQSPSFTFKPSADAYVIQTSPDTNYGTSASIRVDNSPYIHSYLRFTVSGLNGAAIQSAKLRVYANSANSTGYSVQAESNNTWTESAITYNNAPAAGALINKSAGFKSAAWAVVDVSSYVKAEGTYNFVLTTTSSTNTNLASRESSANAPQLVITGGAAASATPGNPPKSTTAPTQKPTSVPPTATNAPTQVPTNPVAPTSTPTNQPGSDWQPTFPIRAAFYYPWFPQAWDQLSIYPYTNYTPTMGYYSNADPAIVKKHIDMMQYGNIQAGIASWWGQGAQTDTKIGGLLSAAAGTQFRWALYYENESQGDPSASQIHSDLAYILANYGKDPSYLRVNGKFVVFVYSDTNDACGMADRWKQGNTVGAYVVLKVFSGYAKCTSQPDSWHQYSPAVATSKQGTLSYSISPGFWLKGQSMRLARDITRFTQNVKDMVASNANWQLVTTFSEWGEGTAVEPAAEWASSSGYGQYLDALHANGSGTPPQPTQPPQATPTGTNVPPTAAPTNPGPTRTPTQPPAPTNTPTQGPIPTRTPTNPPAPTATATTPPSGSKDPIIFFTGDLVSSSSLARAQKVVAVLKNVMAQHAGTQMLVASTGDNEQENNPTVANYQDYFGTTYGPFVTQGIFMQVRGNHDIQSAGSYTDYNGNVHSSGGAYWTYFGSNARAANISGQMLTDYSYDLGNWHFTALDELSSSLSSASLSFLTSDLAAHAATKCQLVYWHVPTYSSGSAHGDATGLKPLNTAEYNAGVDIQINGHDHDYQRFYPINPSGVRDDAKGITTFIDGIGGQDGRAGSKTSIAQAASAVYMDAFPGGEAIGFIQFTLHASSADYAVYDGNDGSIIDSGTVNCH
jgi:hypothetical protein